MPSGRSTAQRSGCPAGHRNVVTRAHVLPHLGLAAHHKPRKRCSRMCQLRILAEVGRCVHRRPHVSLVRRGTCRVRLSGRLADLSDLVLRKDIDMDDYARRYGLRPLVMHSKLEAGKLVLQRVRCLESLSGRQLCGATLSGLASGRAISNTAISALWRPAHPQGCIRSSADLRVKRACLCRVLHQLHCIECVK
jgi:hypothetical protein